MVKTNPDLMKAMEISYKCLSEDEKTVFLDMASFFIGRKWEDCQFVWQDLRRSPSAILQGLINKSLVKLKAKKELSMHDQIRDFAHHIIENEAVRAGERSRLWDTKTSLEVVTKNEVTPSQLPEKSLKIFT